MENINIEHLLAVAKGYEISDAFGVKPAAVSQWKKNGYIPDEQYGLYARNKIKKPGSKAKVLVLYRRALKKMRQQNAI